MTVGPDGFRQRFPEFKDIVDDDIVYWIDAGVTTINSRVLGDATDLAIMLFAAHNLVIQLRERRAVAGGGIPGDPYMVTTSKAVGPVSKGMSPISSASADPRAGEYADTSYGQRLWRMLRAASFGGLYNPGYRQQAPGYPPNPLMGWPGYLPGRR
jgi:hypothetical protein